MIYNIIQRGKPQKWQARGKQRKGNEAEPRPRSLRERTVSPASKKPKKKKKTQP
jgi:hypothetical protein